MFMPKILFYTFVLYFYETVFAARETGDCSSGCVPILSCEPARNILMNLANSSSADKDKVIRFACGFRDNFPMVCCQEFYAVPNIDTRQGYSEDYARHRNAYLLPVTCGEIDGSRIVGGRVAKLYEFPWMALISYRSAIGLSFKCAGTVINSRYILTAAHCVIWQGVYKNIAGVRIGEWDYSSDVDCQGEDLDMICETKLQDITVEEKIVHPDFGHGSSHNDIALLRLSSDINLTDNNAQPICLPIYENTRNVNLQFKNATVAGWGRLEGGHETTVLMKVEIPILPSDACNQYHGREYSNEPTSFCAGEDKKDSCEGDSGGPLMLESEYRGTYRWVQYGIVSFGPQKCGNGVPGVYTDVTKYMKWILENIKQ